MSRPTTSDSAAVEVRGLSIIVDGSNGERREVVADVGFEIPRGQVLALIGESGSGKTTIALSMMGYNRFGARIEAETLRVGDMAINALDADGLRAIRGRRIAYIAQSAAAAFNPSRPIMAQIIEPLLVHRLADRAAAERKAVELFRALSLPSPETIGYRYPHQVSGGQLQRLMAAMALITDPELVILDEPTTALDVTTQVEVLRTFKTVLARSGATAIYVSHDLAVVAQVADHILVLKDGRISEQGSAQQVLETPRSEYTRTLLAATRPAARPLGKAPDDEILSVRDISAGYGKIANGRAAIPILDDIEFTLRRGATLGVIGESGSGKSTLARVIAGLLPAASGNILLEGEKLAPAMAKRSREQLRRIQLVFQNADTALNPAQTVREILTRPMAFYHGCKGAEADARIAELFELTRLPATLADRRSNELSGGQKQRVNLARALAAKPDVLICDEVTSALDTVVGAAVLQLIDDLRRGLGIATIFISHDISTVSSVCDQMLVLYGGKMVELVSRDEFGGQYSHPYTRLLIDSVPAMDRDWLMRRGSAKAPPLASASRGDASGKPLCRFVARCPLAIAGVCDTIPPPRRSIGQQTLLCHLSPDKLAQVGNNASAPTS